jgi:two-component system chemotaxis response regulator CheY
LIVDDHPINRTLATVLLRGSQWTCEQASSGREALDKLTAGRFDCVLLDISMPDMSGEEVCKEIRSTAALKGLRVIAYTAHTMKDEQEHILAAGFDALLIKPINKSILLETIDAG